MKDKDGQSPEGSPANYPGVFNSEQKTLSQIRWTCRADTWGHPLSRVHRGMHMHVLKHIISTVLTNVQKKINNIEIW